MYGIKKPLVCPIEAAVEIDPLACYFHFNSSPALTWAYMAAMRIGKPAKNMNIISINIQSMSRGFGHT
jgi:hypothetical protein